MTMHRPVHEKPVGECSFKFDEGRACQRSHPMPSLNCVKVLTVVRRPIAKCSQEEIDTVMYMIADLVGRGARGKIEFHRSGFNSLPKSSDVSGGLPEILDLDFSAGGTFL